MLESVNVFDNDDYKNDFFNAEIAKQRIVSKGQTNEIKKYKQLLLKLLSIY